MADVSGSVHIWSQGRRSPYPPAPASPEVQRRFTSLGRYMMVYTPVMVVLSFLPITSEPWLWTKLGIVAIGTIIFIIWATRFSLWQRDEYWREHGKKPETSGTPWQGGRQSPRVEHPGGIETSAAVASPG